MRDDIVVVNNWISDFRKQLYDYAMDPEKKPGPWTVLDRDDGQTMLFY